MIRVIADELSDNIPIHDTLIKKDSTINDIHRKQVQQIIQSNETRLLNMLVSWSSDMRTSPYYEDTAEFPNIHQMIQTRVKEYADEIRGCFDDFIQRVDESVDHHHHHHEEVQGIPFLIPHPNKLLHVISPKIPAIRQSPDIMLRIVTADIQDGQLAAYAIGAVGVAVQLHECYYRQAKYYVNATNNTTTNSSMIIHVQWDEGHTKHHHAVPHDVLSDRRLEQLLECISCRLLDHHDMTIQDIVKVVWGLSAVRYPKLTHTLCDINPREFMDTLVTRTRDLLLQRLHHWHDGPSDLDTEESRDVLQQKTRFYSRLRDLSKDVVSSLQAFQYPGWNSSATQLLFSSCIDILNSNIRDLWVVKGSESSRVQIEEDEIIDKLAKTELVSSIPENVMDPLPLFNQSNTLDDEWDKEGTLVCDLLSMEDKKLVLSILETLGTSHDEDTKIHTIIQHLNS